MRAKQKTLIKDQSFWRPPMSLFAPSSLEVNGSLLKTVVSVSLALVLSACGGTGQEQEETPDTGGTGATVTVYNGPTAQDADTRNFQLYFWENLQSTSRCGECHADSQTPTFVRSDNINLAYQEALQIVNLDNPGDSEIISKVSAGHNCWGGHPDSVCASQLLDFINNWKNGGPSTSAAEVSPQALATGDIRTPSGSRPYASDSTYFEQTLHANILVPYCADCHNEAGETPQQPYFASSNVDSAWIAVQNKLNLSAPSASRMVEFISSGHRTWNGLDYPEAAAELAAEIQAMLDLEDQTYYENNILPLFASQSCVTCHVDDNTRPMFANPDIAISYPAVRDNNLINRAVPSDSALYTRPAGGHRDCGTDCASLAADVLSAIEASSFDFDTTLLHSKAAVVDGDYGSLAASSGGRFNDNVIAMYEFKGPEGTVAFDTSAAQPKLDLQMSGNVEWVGGYGIRLNGSSYAEGTTTDSAKLAQLIKASGEYSIEAWLIAENVEDAERRIVTYSSGQNDRNFMLGQNMYDYTFLNRVSGNETDGTTSSTDNGTPQLSTLEEDEIVQTNKQHVVATFDSTGRKIWVDGRLVAEENSVEESPTGTSFADWNESYKFRLGSEVDGSGAWSGVIKFLAIHDKALNEAEITANFNADVGLKFLLQFNISEQLNKSLAANERVEHAYVVFEVTQFDDFSYLFNAPTFIGLDSNFSLGAPILLEGMHIGLNGKVLEIGQAYSDIGVNLGDSNYDATDGQSLSSIGTVIALENGVGADEFFLVFDQVGSETNPADNTTDPTTLTPAYAEAPKTPFALRTFEEIDATMSKLTGVPRTNVRDTFTGLIQQLPTLSNIQAFDAAHQVAIAQMSIEYCNEMMSDDALRMSIFGDPASGGIDFNDPIADVESAISDALVLRMMHDGGTELADNPARAQVLTVLSDLRANIQDCDNPDTPDTNECDSYVEPTTSLYATSYCATVLGSAPVIFQ